MCNNKKKMFSVMSNQGFGSLTIKKGEFKFIIPQRCIKRKGGISKKIASMLHATITVDEVRKLHEIGVETIKA